MITPLKMINIKESLLDYLKFQDCPLKSITCARVIVHNIGVIDLKVKYTDKELNDFLNELDFDVVRLDLEVIRAYIWMDNGGLLEIDYSDPFDNNGQWALRTIPPIPQDLKR